MIRAAASVVGRPDLWRTAFVQWRRSVPSRWWRRRPFLPVPPAAYVEFRLQTHFGAAQPTGDELADALVSYLEWCRAERRGAVLGR